MSLNPVYKDDSEHAGNGYMCHIKKMIKCAGLTLEGLPYTDLCPGGSNKYDDLITGSLGSTYLQCIARDSGSSGRINLPSLNPSADFSFLYIPSIRI